MKYLTKREYFAAMAMQAQISKYGMSEFLHNAYSEEAVQCADALIQELEKEKG